MRILTHLRKPLKKLNVRRGMTGCCGMDVLDGFYGASPASVVAFVCRFYYLRHSGHSDDETPVPFLIFSASLEDNRLSVDGDVIHNGDSLCEFIRRHRLGRVHKSEKRFNPNSGHLLTAYMWEIDGQALCKYWNQTFDGD